MDPVTSGQASGPVAAQTIAPLPADWSGEQIHLAPVDRLSVLSVCDNTIDALLHDQGVARRLGLASADKAPRTLAAATLADGVTADSPLAGTGSPH